MGYLVYFADGMCTPSRVPFLILSSLPGIERGNFRKVGCQKCSDANLSFQVSAWLSDVKIHLTNKGVPLFQGGRC